MSLGLNKHSNRFVKKFQNKQSTTSNESKEDDKKNWIVLAESTEKKI